MSRLHRFEDYRFIGVRDTMRVYDCDDSGNFEQLSERVAADDLLSRKQLQSFSPDTIEEAENRGFRPLRVQEAT